MNTSMPENTVLLAKLAEAQLPGHTVEFDPVEAEQVGAFREDAMSEAEARDSDLDLAPAWSAAAAWWARVTGGRDDE